MSNFAEELSAYKSRVLLKLFRDKEIVCVEFHRNNIKIIVFDAWEYKGVSKTFEYETEVELTNLQWIENNEHFTDLFFKIGKLLEKDGYVWQKLYFYVVLAECSYTDIFEISAANKEEIAENIHYELNQHLSWKPEECIFRYREITDNLNEMQNQEDSGENNLHKIKIFALNKKLSKAIEDCAEAVKMNLLGITVDSYLDGITVEEDFVNQLDFYERFHEEAELELLKQKYYDSIKVFFLLQQGISMVNFLSEKKHKLQLLFLAKGICLKFSALCCFLGLLLCIVSYGVNSYGQSKLEAAQNKYLSIREWELKQKKYGELQDKIGKLEGMLDKLSKERINWSKAISGYGKVIPNGCWLIGIEQRSYNANKKSEAKELVVHGKAVNAQVATVFFTNLENSGNYTKLELLESEKEKQKLNANTEEVYSFSILLSMKKEDS